MAGTITTGNFPQALRPGGGGKKMRKSAKLRDNEPKAGGAGKKPKAPKGAKGPKGTKGRKRTKKPSGAGTSAFMNAPAPKY